MVSRVADHAMSLVHCPSQCALSLTLLPYMTGTALRERLEPLCKRQHASGGGLDCPGLWTVLKLDNV